MLGMYFKNHSLFHLNVTERNGSLLRPASLNTTAMQQGHPQGADNRLHD
jgi:hypothetical protein